MAFSGNLFSRLTRYRGLYAANPEEDRLTEAFAGFLESVDCQLGAELAKNWLAPGRATGLTNFGERAGEGDHLLIDGLDEATSLQASTQVPLKDRYVDLELKFSGPSGESRIRVEMKKGTEPHDGQIKAYEDRGTDGHPRTPVVILAPAYQLPFTGQEAPETAPQRSWQATYRLIQEFTFRGPDKDREIWLREQFCQYLEEENLSPMDRLNEKHLAALSVIDEAQAGLLEVVNHAAQAVSAQFPTAPATTPVQRKAINSWRHHEVGAILPDEVWAEFKVTDHQIEGSEIAECGVKFIAGLSWKRRTVPASLSDFAPSLEEKGFEIFDEGGCGRLMRILLPEDELFLRAGSIEAQGSALAEWVSESFREIQRVFG